MQQPDPSQPDIRVLIVDDSRVIRRLIRRVLEAAPGIEVVGEAENGKAGVEVAQSTAPHVVTLDVEMPVMDGLTALPLIRAASGAGPRPAVVMVSSLTRKGSETAFKAYALGAADVLAKDGSASVNNTDAFGAGLVRSIRAVAPRIRRRPANAPPTRGTATAPAATARGDNQHAERPPVAASRGVALVGRLHPRLITIASSTGGPPVVERLVRALPAGTTVPVLIAQHMPALFTRTLAERLDRLGPVSVTLARHRDPILPGRVYLAEGGQHTRVVAGDPPRIEVGPEPASAPFKPSCDELFRSAADAAGGPVLGVVLTGMGEDGSVGAKRVREKGGLVLSQHASTCVVYGMPRAVDAAGITAASMSPDGLAEAVASVAVATGAEARYRRSA